MSNNSASPFTSISRYLVLGAVFFLALLMAAAAYTSGRGMEAREALARNGSAVGARIAAADEIDALLGRGGLAGRLMIYAVEPSPDTFALMEELIADARGQLNTYEGAMNRAYVSEFVETARGRLAESELALAAISSGARTPTAVAVDYNGGVAAFDRALDDFRTAERRSQTAEALSILDLQRWIIGLTLAASVIALGGAAIAFWFGVRRPLRQLADHLEDLMVDEEERQIPESSRGDEIGVLARVAEQMRRSQLQAGRLLTFGPEGALRLRLEGSNAHAVDEALGELKSAATAARTTATAMTGSSDRMAKTSEDIMARIEAALTETVAETSGQLQSLSDAGGEVIRLASELEGSRRAFSGTEAEWREEMAALGTTLRGEFERLRDTADRLGKMTETAASRADSASGHLAKLADGWDKDHQAHLSASTEMRGALAKRVKDLDMQIAGLGETLGGLEALSRKTAEPLEAATQALLKSASKLGGAAGEASTATGLWSKEVEAARAQRAHAASESDADRAYWKKERHALRLEIDNALNDLVDTAARVGAFAEDLHDGAGDLPGRFDMLQADIKVLQDKLGSLETSSSSIAGKLGSELGALHEALQDARDAFHQEAVMIGEVTGDLASRHVRFTEESQIISEQVLAISESLGALDENIGTLTQRITTPVDLSPVLGALRNEMGRAVTHLTQVVEGQSHETRRALGEQTAERTASVANELAAFSRALEIRSEEQGKLTGDLIAAMDDLNERLMNDAAGQGRDTASALEPQMIALGDTMRAMAHEVRNISGKIHQPQDASEVLAHITRVEHLQASLGQAQQSIATALRDGLSGISQRIKAGGGAVVGASADPHTGEAIAKVMRQQERLGEAIYAMTAELGSRIDDLAAELLQPGAPYHDGYQPQATATYTNPAYAAPAADRVSGVLPPEEADLGAIYDALRGLTEELKDLSTDEMPPAPERPAQRRVS